MSNWGLAASSQDHTYSCIMSHAEFFGKIANHPGDIVPLYSPELAPCNFWLFPKLKSALKWKRFQIIDEIQEDMMRQQMAIPTKGFEECFEQWERCWENCVRSQGAYLEGD